MSHSLLIVIGITLPGIGAAVLALLGRWPNLRDSVALIIAILTFATIYQLYIPVETGIRPALHILDLTSDLNLSFHLEPLGMLFALVASSLWILTLLYAIGYMRNHHEENQTRFFSFFSLAIAAALGAAFSGNMLTLFFFYELLTLSTYPLVTHHRTQAALKAGRIYMGILLTTSIGFLLLAIILTYLFSGNLNFVPGGILPNKTSDLMTIVLLMLYAYGTGKAALIPIHGWLPNAMVAPTPVSALLHAVAVVKTGVFTILKVVIYIFGIDNLRGIDSHIVLTYSATFTIVIASLIALRQDNLKARLAYSTVGQLAYIILGASLANTAGIIGASLHIAIHAFGKITLFFCAGAIMVRLHKTEISDMQGIGRTMPITMTAFLIASLSIIGLPPLGGTWSKWYLLSGTLEAGFTFATIALLISSLLNIAYLLPIPIRAFFYSDKNQNTQISEAPLACVLPLVITATISIGLFIYPDPFLSLCIQLIE